MDMSDPNSPSARFQIWRAALPPALRLLLTVNLASFAVSAVLAILAAFGLGALYMLAIEMLALPGDPAKALFRPWTPFTYGFFDPIQGGLWGLIAFAFAMYWLNWLGRDFEESLGGYRLFGLYLGAAVFGAAIALALGAVTSAPPVRSFYAGAWGPVTAVLVCVATLYPNRGIGLFLLGVIALKWIAVAFVVLSLFAPDASLLGAALFGFVFAKAHQRGIDLAAWARPLFDRRPKRTSRSAPSSGTRGSRYTSSDASSSSRTVGKAVATRAATSRKRSNTPPPTVDAVLDKILDKGYDSLTAEEKRILDEASRDG
ncbi:MAG: rhomboid family intramembrane serine protease [Rubricoccaceae bacterium]